MRGGRFVPPSAFFVRKNGADLIGVFLRLIGLPWAIPKIELNEPLMGLALAS